MPPLSSTSTALTWWLQPASSQWLDPGMAWGNPHCGTWHTPCTLTHSLSHYSSDCVSSLVWKEHWMSHIEIQAVRVWIFILSFLSLWWILAHDISRSQERKKCFSSTLQGMPWEQWGKRRTTQPVNLPEVWAHATRSPRVPSKPELPPMYSRVDTATLYWEHGF